MKKKTLAIIMLFIIIGKSVYAQFEKGTGFINTSFSFLKTNENSQEIGLDRNSYGFGINAGYSHFFKKNQAISFGVGYSNNRNRVNYSAASSFESFTQKSNGFEGILSYAIYNKKRSNFFLSHQFDIRYGFEKSSSQFPMNTSDLGIDSKLAYLSFTLSPLVLNYQLNERLFISTPSFLSFWINFRKYRETDNNTNQTDVSTRSDYQVSFLPILASFSIFYYIK